MNLQVLQGFVIYIYENFRYSLRIQKVSSQKSWIPFSKSKFRSEGHINDVKCRFWNAAQFWLCEERSFKAPLPPISSCWCHQSFLCLFVLFWVFFVPNKVYLNLDQSRGCSSPFRLWNVNFWVKSTHIIAASFTPFFQTVEYMVLWLSPVCVCVWSQGYPVRTNESSLGNKNQHYLDC